MFRMRLTFIALAAFLSMSSVNQTTAQDKPCASLHQCAEVGDTKRLSELLRQTATIDVPNDYGETPLFTAVRYDNRDATALLISAGAKVNTRNKDGTTPLMMAVLGQDLPLITQLVAVGADVNASDDDGDTVLMHGAVFAVKQTIPILRFLVSRGANVNAAAKDGRTALMLSVRSTVVDNVECLLSLGANVNAKDNKRLTAFDHVNDIWETSPKDYARKIQRQMRKVLIAAGASH